MSADLAIKNARLMTRQDIIELQRAYLAATAKVRELQAGTK